MEFVLFCSLGFIIVRAISPGTGLHAEDVFKDMAHCWVGGLISAWLVRRDLRWQLGWFVVALVLAEVTCAILKN